jgi:hypothetical protein
MLRVIKEMEPLKPSTKLARSGTLPSIAARRQTEPHRFTALVRGELDWIVIKALEKDRYSHIEAVAARRICCGVPHRGDQTTGGMGKLSGCIPQASRRRKCWRAM